ncbi:MAG TPA: hypothetical protein VF250_12690 [Conexibacter sp.]
MPTGVLRTARKGLATVAMLKANFDARHDHIGMFEPFVRDTIAQLGRDDFTLDELRVEIGERHQLRLPFNTLRTLLARLVRDGVLQREAGRYFRTHELAGAVDLCEQRERVEGQQARLADALCVEAQSHGVELGTDAALTLILRFIERYHVALALDGVTVIPAEGRDAALDDDDDGADDGGLLATAAFLRRVALAGGEMTDVLQAMVEGFVLQNTLLLKDVSSAHRQFHGLQVFCDSSVLFAALGLRGPAAEKATVELLTLLRDTGAVLGAFEPTIREMRRILAIYEDAVATAHGRERLHPTELTRFVLSQNYGPSDVRIRSELMMRDLRELGFEIRETPQRRPQFTLDEGKLGRMLRDRRRGGENHPRVVHDVDCVAGVLTLRAGGSASSIDDCRAVFMTGSSMTVRNTTRWYRAQGGRGFPPIVHHLALSNFAWLKRPSSASELKLHELVALCTAALRPSRATWEAFRDHLGRMETNGELSSDEVTAITVSALTEDLLAEEGIGDDVDAESLAEVIDRVKASYRVEMDQEIRRIRAEAEQERAQAEREKAEIERRARAAEALAEERAQEAAARAAVAAERQNGVKARIRKVASASSWLLAGLLTISLIAGVVVGIVHTAAGRPPGAVALALAVGPLTVFGALSVLSGFTIKRWRRCVEERLFRWLGSWLVGPDDEPPRPKP